MKIKLVQKMDFIKAKISNILEDLLKVNFMVLENKKGMATFFKGNFKKEKKLMAN
jgi:hypothetical protein